MLKARVIGIVCVKDGWAVQSIGFKKFLPIGRPEICVEFLDRYGADEIALLDIAATHNGTGPDLDMVARCARKCHVPIAVGGGVNRIQHVHDLVRNGADKVVINTAAISNPALITEGALHFGSQCMVVSLDARRSPDGRYEIYSEAGSRASGLTPIQAARQAEEGGAGEILITSIDNDGLRNGYDIDLIRLVRQGVAIPVIAAGGAGHPVHFAEGLAAGADAVAAGNMLNYTEHSVALIKRFLLNGAANVRMDGYAAYEGATFDSDGRLLKRDEEILEDLLFVRISEEVI
jgi:cyclase